MNFLNEAAEQFPSAISFASGRPAEQFFDVHELLAHVPRFISHWSERTGRDIRASTALLGQYGPTSGIINDIVARQVALDEGIACGPDQVFMTAGCQEALLLCCRELCRAGEDVILVRNPTYIGITGVADLSGIDLWPVQEGDGATFADALTEAIVAVRRAGKRPRLLYLIPEFDNPTGTTLDERERREILEVCAGAEVVVLEDNPYGMFRFEGARPPSMFSLDRAGCVLYLGTYSKTLCPNVRVGFVLAPPSGPTVVPPGILAGLSRAKSFGSLNTSQIMQAAVGGLLIAEGYSLAGRVAVATDHYRRNRDRMVSALSNSSIVASGGVSLSHAAGGFFITLELPFVFGTQQLQACARDHGVLIMPLSFFAFDDSENRRVRLAYSNVAPDQIDAGAERLLGYISEQL